MNDEVLVKVERVSKKFCRSLKRSLYYGVRDISSELFGIRKNGQLRKEEFWAVKDVSFELKRGECLGLIGHNGAGKSTLLKMLNGLIKPDKGTITMKGRVGALIELGAGFNPILTGRENIYNNGAVLGFSKKEIDKKFNAIMEFAEINEFIDTPVQNYSSGMRVRLGFAVAVQMEPDVLLIDEVLAVGDIGFRIKCFNKIAELINETCIVFVSHSMIQIARISSSILLMNNGKMKFFNNNISDGINMYFKYFENDNKLRIQSTGCELKVINYDQSVKYNDHFDINLNLRFTKISKFVEIAIIFSDSELKQIASIHSPLQNVTGISERNFSIRIQPVLFTGGKLSGTIIVRSYIDESKRNRKILCRYMNAFSVHVINDDFIEPTPIVLYSTCKVNSKYYV